VFIDIGEDKQFAFWHLFYPSWLWNNRKSL